MTASLQIKVLGAPELSVDGLPLTGLRSHKAIALLIYLACNPGPKRREFLADLLWDATSTTQSLSNLRTALTRLRRHAADYLLITPETLAIAPNPAVIVDVATLEGQLATITERLSPHSATQLALALGIYRGEFLAGFYLPDASGFEQWSILERERLRFVVLQNYRRLADYFLQQRDYPAGMRATAAWLRVDPLDEEAHSQRMRLLAGDGQRAAALAHYESCRQILHTELDVEPGEELQALYRQITEATAAAPTPADSAPASSPIRHNLPRRLTSFVGRAEEMSTIRALFATPTTRLVTLTGEGGMGKSSLAVAAGEEMLDLWPDGVFFTPLMEVEAYPLPTLHHRLATSVAEAVGLTFSTARGAADSQIQLFNFLSDRSLLLILDNFEHLSAGASFISDLLQAAPGCRVLITSREGLLLEGESVVRLHGLPVPPLEASLPLPDEAYASAALFIERAREREYTFSISPANREALGHLCRLVAGNALALELAAAWVEHFSLPEMAALLAADLLDFPRSTRPQAPERHRSLRRVMETSWRLLSADAQRMLAQISIFRGSFHRQAALAVTGGSLALLADLVNCSLLQPSGSGRYELHEMVRQFAAEQLATFADEQNELAQRHARYYLSLMGRVERTAEMIAQVTEELANVRQAWGWAVESGDVDGLAAASTGLWNFYLRKGLFQEAEDAFGRGIVALLATPPDHEGRRRALASLHVAQAVFLNIRSHYAEAIAVAEEAVGYALQEEDEGISARGYLQWGTALYRQGHYGEAVGRFQMALTAAQDAKLDGDVADILRHLGVTWLEQGDFAAAISHCESALILYRRTGNQLGEGNTLTDLGWIQQRCQNFEEARTYLEAAQRVHAAIDNRHGVTMALINLGIVQQMLGDYSQAYNTYQQLLEEVDKLPDRYHHSLVNHSLGVLLSRMGDYSNAHRHLMAAVEIDRAIGDQGGLAWSYNALGMIHNHLGDPKTGLVYHNQALRIGQEQGARTVEGIALLGLGQDLHALGQWADACAAYEKAIVVQSKLKPSVRVIESRSGLALPLLALDQPDAALAQVEEVLTYLATQSLRGAAQPALVYWNCYRVLRAYEDPRAATLLEQASDLVQQQAARIDDKKLRHAYLYAEPTHRAITDEVESLRWLSSATEPEKQIAKRNGGKARKLGNARLSGDSALHM
ncbi:MAG: tetratricopeptide repeat protein [Caldilineaceae bacterium]|nr:tetratricopeptide repeat protein [Caldilineaceae bacterium]